jgi:Protein of unknown function (DUF3592)
MSNVENGAGTKKAAPSPLTLVAMIFWPFLFIGAIALLYGLKLGADQWTFRRAAAHATGIVVGFDRAPRSGGTVTYHPIVRYDAPSGESVQFRCYYAYPKEDYKLEQTVDVLFDPANPRKAEIDSNQSRYAVFLMPAFGAGLGAMALVAYVILLVIQRLVVSKRRGERDQPV